MTVTYTTVNIANGGGSANLLINPRGKINQANESQGVLSAGQYFCDGWKAGDAGAEVYIDSDGFRLISGSIVQLVPNTMDAGKRLRGNMDKINGTPLMRINGGTDSVLANSDEFIKVEIVGDNSKFNRVVVSESEELPIYQQLVNELEPCLRFYRVLSGRYHRYMAIAVDSVQSEYIGEFYKIPALSWDAMSGAASIYGTVHGFEWQATAESRFSVDYLRMDARP